MAATEEANISTAKTPYIEMILAAITDLADDGSSEKSITEYIEGRYFDTVGEDYTAEISSTLTKLQESGDLLFVNDLYKIPIPPRRGRGRPKKVKPAVPPEAEPPAQKRPRGRPPKQRDSQLNAVKAVPRRRGRKPKPKDSNAAAVTKAGGIPRRRGRPSKNYVAAVSGGSKTASKGDEAAPSVSGVKRGRGRPPSVSGVKRGRGRPPSVSGVKRGRGRPPSVPGVKRGRGRPAKVK